MRRTRWAVWMVPAMILLAGCGAGRLGSGLQSGGGGGGGGGVAGAGSSTSSPASTGTSAPQAGSGGGGGPVLPSLPVPRETTAPGAPGGSGSSTTGSGGAGSTGSGGGRSAGGGAPAVPANPVSVDVFTSPTGNIICAITDSDSPRAECDIEEVDFKVAARPGGCQLDWQGRHAYVDTAAGIGRCAGDPSAAWVYNNQYGGTVLEYGETTVVDGLACQSSSSGMTCWNIANEHGFTISRSRLVTF